MKPELTVVMLVYNGEKYLTEAINSVLDQTFTDFELIIINDGSSDSSPAILNNLVDDRIKVVHNDTNRGIAYSRNLGLSLAQGKYLTWTDCDDINEPTRFEEQVSFLNTHPSVGICSTALKRFGNNEQHGFRTETDSELLKSMLVFRPSIPNAPAMLRMHEVNVFGIRYDDRLPLAEDYDFIFNCSKVMNLSNLTKVLYRYRASETSIMRSVADDDRRKRAILAIVYEKILNYLDIPPTAHNVNLHYNITDEAVIRTKDELVTYANWFCELINANQRSQRYDERTFLKAVSREFCYVCKKASPLGLPAFIFYVQKCLTTFQFATLLNVSKVFGRSILKTQAI